MMVTRPGEGMARHTIRCGHPRRCRPLFRAYERVHLVGVAGAGMEGLARILHEMGCQVSGSDCSASRSLTALRRDGIDARLGHEAENVQGVDLVIHSAAVPRDNAEITRALDLGIPTIGRARFMAELVRPYYSVAVAGTHGKTTTASMVAAVLSGAGMDPSVLIGGWVAGGPQAKLGSGELFVVEADEYDRSFLQLSPQMALITNVDSDHLDCYDSVEAIGDAFEQFLHRVPFYGTIIVNGDDAGSLSLSTGEGIRRLTYGLGDTCDIRAASVVLEARGSSFELRSRGELLGDVALRVPGRHNVSNAVGAAALALSLDVAPPDVLAGLASFGGVVRRFELKGVLANDVLVIDDYAHHPTEVAAALETAHRTGRRVLVAFQPHLYSRTRDLAPEFARALLAADAVFLAPIFGSREAPQPGVDSALIATAMEAEGGKAAVLVDRLCELSQVLAAAAQPGDLILTMGAGDIDSVANALVTDGE